MTTLRLSNESFTLQAACRDERNILQGLQRSSLTASMLDRLWTQREAIRSIVASHLGLLCDTQCVVEHPDTWMKGRFNVCILLQVEDNAGLVSRKVFRCPMPHKVGGSHTVDEKIRAEVANYVWVEEKCPEIPIPRLIGFGFGKTTQYTHCRQLSLFHRCIFQATRIFKKIVYRHLQTSEYVQRSDLAAFTHPYMLLEYITQDTGRMLSDTWRTFRDDSAKRESLFRGLSRIMLSFARLPHDRIGSLRFDDSGYISTTTRPLICTNVILEGEGAPEVVRSTYRESYAFVSDMLKFRDEAFMRQPNAVCDEEDCRLQMSHAVTLRAVMHNLVDTHYDGPFVLQHPDLHASNIFVDEDWNITAIIDMEFVCALPPQMLGVPYWLSVDYIDDVADNAERYAETYEAFLRVLAEEQRRIRPCHPIDIVTEIRKAWCSGAYWFYHCLTTVNAMPSIVEDHIYPKFGYNASLSEQRDFMKTLSQFWGEDAAYWVEKKVDDKRQYDVDMRAHFESKLD